MSRVSAESKKFSRPINLVKLQHNNKQHSCFGGNSAFTKQDLKDSSWLVNVKQNQKFI